MFDDYCVEMGALGGVIIAVYVIMVLVYISLIGARYVSVAVLFTKADEAPWKSIIPVYDMYTFFKLTWNTKMFIAYIATLVGYVIGLIAVIVMASQYNYYYSGIGGMVIAIIFMFACAVAYMVFEIMLQVKIAHAYGKGGGFAVGLIFLNIIFMMILAFGPAKYREDPKESLPEPALEYKYVSKPEESSKDE